MEYKRNTEFIEKWQRRQPGYQPLLLPGLSPQPLPEMTTPSVQTARPAIEDVNKNIGILDKTRLLYEPKKSKKII